jgi:hypothetical protein
MPRNYEKGNRPKGEIIMKTLLVVLASGALLATTARAADQGTGAAPAGAATTGQMTTGEAGMAEPGGAERLTAEIKIGTDLQDREVVGESTNFGTDVEKVVGWTRITGAGMPTEITHVWKRNGEEVSSVPLRVQSASYRTYSRKTIAGMPGNWSLEVKDANGNIIASKEFTVGAGAAAAPATTNPPSTVAPGAGSTPGTGQ